MAKVRAVWNTGRYYGEKGQRIAAEYDGKEIRFADVDRCIAGLYKPLFAIGDNDTARLKQVVMSVYDANEFEPAWDLDIQALYDKAATI